MSFNWWDSYYGNYLGVKAHGQLGKKFIFYCVNNRQLKRRYNVQQNISHPEQIRRHHLFRHANYSWTALRENQKKEERKKQQYDPTMSGYNYFISNYLKYWGPIFEEAELRIKSVQSGSLNCISGENNITINAVDINKSIVIVPAFTERFGDGKDNGKGVFGGHLSTSTNLIIRAHRGANYNDCRAVWQVVEVE